MEEREFTNYKDLLNYIKQLTETDGELVTHKLIYNKYFEIVNWGYRSTEKWSNLSENGLYEMI